MTFWICLASSELSEQLTRLSAVRKALEIQVFQKLVIELRRSSMTSALT